jgi:Putative MetA-pathway of phenol degradation
MSKSVLTLMVGCVLLHAGVAAAQDTPLSQILVKLIQNDVRLAGPPPGSVFPSHEAHFLPGEDQKLAPYLFNQSIVSQLSTFPLGSSAGGFSYTFDPALGTFTRSTHSFGPSFAERAVTLGRKKLAIGANYQHATFTSYEGKPLDNGSVQFYLTHQPISGAFFEGDIIRTSLSMDLKTDTFAFFANVGVTDRLDVGVAVPVSQVSLNASIVADIIRLGTLDTGPTSTIHTFDGGGSSATYKDQGSAMGIGDILLRAKYRLLDTNGGGLAIAMDLRAPTGDSDNLLGTGSTQAKVLAVLSNSYDRFSPHVNLGYTFSGKSKNTFLNVTNEFNYAGGAEFAASPKVTIVGDLVGRQLRDSGRLVEQPRAFHWTTQAGVSGTTTFSEFALQAGSLNLALASAGVKFNPTRTLLISGNVLFPLSDAGIRSRPVPVIGFEYSF